MEVQTTGECFCNLDYDLTTGSTDLLQFENCLFVLSLAIIVSNGI